MKKFFFIAINLKVYNAIKLLSLSAKVNTTFVAFLLKEGLKNNLQIQ